MNLMEVLVEMNHEELEEAGAVGDEMTLAMIHGVLNNIIAKHGGDFEAASKSPEWQIALKHGEEARKSSVAATQAAKQTQAASQQQKAASGVLSRIRAKIDATKQQRQSKPPVAPMNNREKMQYADTQPATVGNPTKTESISKLTETIRKLIREALLEAKNNG